MRGRLQAAGFAVESADSYGQGLRKGEAGSRCSNRPSGYDKIAVAGPHCPALALRGDKAVMKRVLFFCAAAMAASAPVHAQQLMSDVFSGKLIEPEAGVYSWYDLKDLKTGSVYYLRQAIVGEEKVGKAQAYWVETEVTPQVGFPTVYKMLLTGPASDPKHIHRLLVREGAEVAQEMPVDVAAEEQKKSKQDEGKRTSQGEEEVKLADGSSLKADHVIVEKGGERTELWLNNSVRPMGIVRVLNADGELILRRYGKGGKDAESALSAQAAGQPAAGGWKVETSVSPAPEPGNDATPQETAGNKGRVKSKGKSKEEKP